MSTLPHLQLIKKFLSISDIDMLGDFFVQTLYEQIGTGQVIVFGIDSYKEKLIASYSYPLAADNWPQVGVDEVNSPVVYALLSDKACFVDNVSRLIDVGKGFQHLRSKLAFDGALLAYPMKDVHGSHKGVLVIHADAARLKAHKEDAQWGVLMDIFIQAYINRSTHQQQDQSMRFEKAYMGQQLNRNMHKQAISFIASEYVGAGAKAQYVRSEIVDVANSQLSVLLTGETGVGKDYIASLIHKISAKGQKPFVAVNCAAISKELVESELFGSVKGAFTGAGNRQGLVAAAHQGTLFLDEIGDMPLTLQSSLLRLLNEKKYRPVGSTDEKKSDFRLICATNRSIPELIERGEFREDLYFRIRQNVLEIPALRDRLEDLEELCQFMIQEYNRESQQHVAGISFEAIELLKAYNFPGNIRELKYLLIAACERTSSGDVIGAPEVRHVLSRVDHSIDFDGLIESQLPVTGKERLHELMDTLMGTNDLPAAIDHFERLIIDERLALSAGSRQIAADSLGVPIRTLSRKCQKWNLKGAIEE